MTGYDFTGRVVLELWQNSRKALRPATACQETVTVRNSQKIRNLLI